MQAERSHSNFILLKSIIKQSRSVFVGEPYEYRGEESARIRSFCRAGAFQLFMINFYIDTSSSRSAHFWLKTKLSENKNITAPFSCILHSSTKRMSEQHTALSQPDQQLEYLLALGRMLLGSVCFVPLSLLPPTSACPPLGEVTFVLLPPSPGQPDTTGWRTLLRLCQWEIYVYLQRICKQTCKVLFYIIDYIV